MDVTNSTSMYATIAYADVFDYPLTEDEVAYWSIGKRFVPQKAYSGITHVSPYFFLTGRQQILHTRKKRYAWSVAKWKVAHRVGTALAHIPTIELVGVTGALAMNNAHKEDDIDFLIIAVPGTIWVTRLLAVMVMQYLGVRRKPHATNVADKVCLNMFMTSDALTIVSQEQDLFSAHEVIQMKPLWEREHIYHRFLTSNAWVKKFLPNAASGAYARARLYHHVYDIAEIRGVYIFFLKLLEPLCSFFERVYMEKRRTNETISGSILRFHPRDARLWIKEALRKRLRVHNIPLDNIFYAS